MQVQSFGAEDVRRTVKVDGERRDTGRQGYAMEAPQNFIGHGLEGWALTQHYEEAGWLRPREERAEFVEHWYWHDMDEEKYM